MGILRFRTTGILDIPTDDGDAVDGHQKQKDNAWDTDD